MTTLTVVVRGEPIPQGSKVGGRTKTGRSYVRDDNPRLKPWRAKVTEAAQIAATRAGHVRWDTEPIRVAMTFVHPRPATHYVSAKRHRPLKPTAPDYVTTTPDLDKLVRAILDAFTVAGVWRDDSQVALLSFVQHRYGPDPGVVIEARPIPRERLTNG